LWARKSTVYAHLAPGVLEFPDCPRYNLVFVARRSIGKRHHLPLSGFFDSFMEIICPNCRQVVIAVTRRLNCNQCSTPIDAWEILLGTRPVKRSVSPPDPDLAAGANETRDDLQDVVEIPPLLVAASDSSEPYPILELDFGKTKSRRQARALTDDIPAEIDIGWSQSALDKGVALPPSKELRQRKRSAAWVAVIGGLALGAAIVVYLFGDGIVSSVSRAGGGDEATPAAAGLPPGATPGNATETPAQATPESNSSASPLHNPTASPGLGTPSPAPTPNPTPTPTPTPAANPAGTVTEANPSGAQEPPTRARTVTNVESSSGAFTLQVAARRKENEARQIAKRLIEKGFDARLVTTGTEGNYWHRVRVGSFPTRQDAEIYGEQLKQAGAITEYFVTDKRQ
jgi:cell division septation protein DedD